MKDKQQTTIVINRARDLRDVIGALYPDGASEGVSLEGLERLMEHYREMGMPIDLDAIYYGQKLIEAPTIRDLYCEAFGNPSTKTEEQQREALEEEGTILEIEGGGFLFF